MLITTPDRAVRGLCQTLETGGWASAASGGVHTSDALGAGALALLGAKAVKQGASVTALVP